MSKPKAIKSVKDVPEVCPLEQRLHFLLGKSAAYVLRDDYSASDAKVCEGLLHELALVEMLLGYRE